MTAEDADMLINKKIIKQKEIKNYGKQRVTGSIRKKQKILSNNH